VIRNYPQQRIPLRSYCEIRAFPALAVCTPSTIVDKDTIEARDMIIEHFKRNVVSSKVSSKVHKL
jgi:hypothetical protein